MDNIFGNRFYGHRTPAWHNLGVVTDEGTTAQEAIAILGSYWFEKRPVTVMLNGVQVEVGDYAIVRSPTPDDPMERNLGYVGNGYNIVQPDRIAELFDEHVSGDVETMGMLGKGERLFLTWELNPFTVAGDDMSSYGLVACGYDGKMGASLYLTTVRVVCQNTLNLAIQRSEKENSGQNSRLYVGRHNSINVERDLGLWMAHVAGKADEKLSEVAAMFNELAKIKIENDSQVNNILAQVYPDPKPVAEWQPETLKKEAWKKFDEEMDKIEADRRLVAKLFGGEGTAIDPTAWGLFNAVTEKENYTGVIKKPIENSVMFGNRQKVMARAYDVFAGMIA